MLPQTIICMKWGTRYGPDYVNRLYSMVKRHTRRPVRLICFTDDPAGITAAVETAPLPPIDLPARVFVRGKWIDVRNLPWRKIALWQKGLGGLSGEVLFLDLDLLITGPLDEFFDYEPGRVCAIRNWTQPDSRIGNTSVYRFEVGAHTNLYERMMSDGADIVATYGNSQTFVSREIRDMSFWPDEWCVSFKHSLVPAWPLNFLVTPKLPSTARVVAFTGKPDPDEAAEGRWPASGLKRFYKHIRPTPWIAEHWQ
jgi:hypothetical protein